MNRFFCFKFIAINTNKPKISFSKKIFLKLTLLMFHLQNVNLKKQNLADIIYFF